MYNIPQLHTHALCILFWGFHSNAEKKEEKKWGVNCRKFCVTMHIPGKQVLEKRKMMMIIIITIIFIIIVPFSKSSKMLSGLSVLITIYLQAKLSSYWGPLKLKKYRMTDLQWYRLYLTTFHHLVGGQECIRNSGYFPTQH